MAIWKDQPTGKSGNAPAPAPANSPDPTPIRNNTNDYGDVSRSAAPARSAERELKESLIASELTIEGKIEGAGHVRIAGKFKGDVNVQGNLTIESGARLTGSVRANKVVIAGEVEGNIESAQQVELLAGGALTGDIKAGSLTVASGARMKGQADFGWEEKAKSSSPAKAAESALG
ncbi:MAG TPA: polymer-forming cytoskeletal protein [Xanthomonadaceae bacterium]|nr:polymer-forming cytoskeletal protein [Xanthomonadaceae bacterium]